MRNCQQQITAARATGAPCRGAASFNHRVNLTRSGADNARMGAIAGNAPSRAGYAQAVSVTRLMRISRKQAGNLNEKSSDAKIEEGGELNDRRIAGYNYSSKKAKDIFGYKYHQFLICGRCTRDAGCNY